MYCVQCILGLQFMEWHRLMEDAEKAGQIEIAKNIEMTELIANDVSKKLWQGEKDLTKSEITLLINLFEKLECTEASAELLEEIKDILKTLRAYN